jgi:hypothetical protein
MHQTNIPITSSQLGLETLSLWGPNHRELSVAGRILAEEVKSTEPLPPFPASTRDGYAIRQETPGWENVDGEYEVVAIIQAGQDVTKLPPFSHPRSQAYKIMTGAPVPPFCNSIVMVSLYIFFFFQDPHCSPSDRNNTD